MTAAAQIIFMDDILAPDQTALNAEKLEALLAPVFNVLLPQIPVFAMPEQKRNELAGFFYASVGLSPSSETLLALYDGKPNPRQLALLTDAFKDAFVISTGLSPLLKKAFAKIGVPFIDVIPHPAQFLQNPVFGVSSSLSGFSEVLAPWLVSEDQLYQAAMAASATAGCWPRMEQCLEYADIGLFISQPLFDTATIRNGKFMRLEDAAGRIFEIVKSHEYIFVKIPQGQPPRQDILLLTQLCPRVKVISDNFYHLLNHESVTSVYGLNSPRLLEARYFNKKCHNLIPFQYEFSTMSSAEDCYAPVYEGIIQSGFWAVIFEKTEFKSRNVKFPSYNLNLRKSLNMNGEEAPLFAS